jgi:hypothetical protein
MLRKAPLIDSVQRSTEAQAKSFKPLQPIFQLIAILQQAQ